jgi:FdhE protein
MTELRAPGYDPITIGEVVKAPFARLPDPRAMFADRGQRLRALAEGHALRSYLHFLAALSDVQHQLQAGLPDPRLPSADALLRARQHCMPPLDRASFTPDGAVDVVWDRLIGMADGIMMPDAARLALARVKSATAADQAAMMSAVLSNAIPVEALADHVFVAAALQIHFARLAARLDAGALVPVGDGACPACGSPPVSSMVVGWGGAQNARFCACSICGTLWNYPRVRCTLCGATKGIAYQEIAGGPATVKAETCESCRGYVKILHQHKEPLLDPIADDVATLALDLLVRDLGYRRGAINPFLLGYC